MTRQVRRKLLQHGATNDFNEQVYVEVMPSMTQVSQKDRFTTVESLRIIFKKKT